MQCTSELEHKLETGTAEARAPEPSCSWSMLRHRQARCRPGEYAALSHLPSGWGLEQAIGGAGSCVQCNLKRLHATGGHVSIDACPAHPGGST